MSLLDIHPADLERLSEFDAVALFAMLLWAEESRLKLNTFIDIPFSIHSPDGGIDAKVEGLSEVVGSDIIGPGNTWYQIKTGAFSVSETKGDIKKLLVDNEGNLKPKVEQCFSTGGQFVAVLFGADPTDRIEDEAAEKRIVDYLKDNFPNIDNPKVKVIKQNHIIKQLAWYPSLKRRLKSHLFPGQCFDEWAMDQDMGYPLESSGRIRQDSNQLTEEIKLLSDLAKTLRIRTQSLGIS